MNSGGSVLSQLKKVVPAYLWFSGVLLQFLLVLLGLQYLIGLIERRPTHALERAVSQRLSDEAVCTSLFSGQEFSWLHAKPFSMNLLHNRAQIVRLAYNNSGSIARQAGNHIYHVWFDVEIKDKKSGEVVRFPPRIDQYFEVDTQNKIVKCTGSMRDRYLAEPNLQEPQEKPCESRGWKRRLLCDKGTSRCYPISQCELIGAT